MSKTFKDMRRLFREAVADYATEHTVPETAKEFGISTKTVYEYCNREGVEYCRSVRGRKPGQSLSKLKALKYLLEGHPTSDVAVFMKTSPSVVSQIKREALDAGFAFPIQEREISKNGRRREIPTEF